MNIKEETRKELIEYYKWVVGLLGLILTLTISVVKIGPKQPNDWMVCGWCFYLTSIFFNWLLIKRLIILPLLPKISDQYKSLLQLIYESTFGNVQIYASIQNTAIIIGSILLVVGFWKF